MDSRRASMADLSEGSQFSNVDATITDICAYQNYQFTKLDGSPGKKSKSAGVAIIYLTEAQKVIQDFFELGADFLPAASAEDADAGVSAAQGDFITLIEGSTRKLSPTFGWGVYVAALKKVGYPLDKLDNEGLSAAIGETFHLVNQEAGERNPPGPKGEKHWYKRVPSAWKSKPEGESAPADSPHKQPTARPGAVLAGIEQRLTPIILDILETAGKPLGKAKISQLFAEAVAGDSAWSESDRDAAQALILRADTYKSISGVVSPDGIKYALVG